MAAVTVHIAKGFTARFIGNAYARRSALSENELERLLAALKDEAERYRYASRNYPRERMVQYGQPFLSKLEERIVEVDRLLRERAPRSS